MIINNSIFCEYYKQNTLIDKYQDMPEEGLTVIIPIIHTNELWKNNLYSIYKEVPVKRLLISDGGCKDNSIEIVKQFPRVEILNHHNYKTLGYCLKELILHVETKWFIYLHSDVYLPSGWYNTMTSYKGEYDWFGCPQQITVMAEYKNTDKMQGVLRPYAGSQMGKKEAFIRGIDIIDDDFVYRQEDFVLAKIVEDNGYKHGFVEDTFHYHQVMHKESPWSRKINNVQVNVEWSDAEIIRASTMQVMGIIKYLDPLPHLIREVETHIATLKQFNSFKKKEFMEWIENTNPLWNSKISIRNVYMRLIYKKYFKNIKEYVRRISNV